jgi:hypothetical protein
VDICAKVISSQNKMVMGPFSPTPVKEIFRKIQVIPYLRLL